MNFRIHNLALIVWVIVHVSCGQDPSSRVDGGSGNDSDSDTDSGGDSDTDTGPDPADPIHDSVNQYQTIIAGNGDPADIYYPEPGESDEGELSLPMALLFQGAEVGKEYYSQFATVVASYGFIVIVPDHQSVGVSGSGLYAEQSEVHHVLAQMYTENTDPDSPIAAMIDTDTLVVLGHSYGGVCGLNIVRDVCELPTCVGLVFDRPQQLKGAAFYGTNVAMPFIGTLISSIGNDEIPVALVQGTLDTMAIPADTQHAYTIIQNPPRAYVGVVGANHYGICDQDNPPGAASESAQPELDQGVSMETIARWSALFLRGHVLGDQGAVDYVHSSGGPGDENVNVVSEQ